LKTRREIAAVKTKAATTMMMTLNFEFFLKMSKSTPIILYYEYIVLLKKEQAFSNDE
jgi:hypothetical protein